MKVMIICCYLLICAGQIYAQEENTPFFKGAIKEKRTTQYRNLVNNTINKNLSVPLTDSTEDNWINAFQAIEQLRLSSAWTEKKVFSSFDEISKRSIEFQMALLELLYSNYGAQFYKQVRTLFNETTNGKIFAACGEFLLKNKAANSQAYEDVFSAIKKQQAINNDSACLKIFTKKILLNNANKQRSYPLKDLLKKEYLKGNVLIFSFQRPGRNFPGLVIIRDTAGNWVKDKTGNIFSVPQLARSVSNLPGYLSNGNTPQGIFRMDGFAISKSDFIGPTPNIQLMMPFETSLQHFFKDPSITDSVWTEKWYRKIFPASWQSLLLQGSNYYNPFYETYYAGNAGRSGIIAHGTTIDPVIYKDQPFYPLIPTQGCLCSKEIWSDVDGKRIESDQQKLVDSLRGAGGADGYGIVIELEDRPAPITMQEILPLLKQY